MGVLWVFVMAVVALVVYLVLQARKDEEHFKNKNIVYLWNTSYRMFRGIAKGTSLYRNVLDIYEAVKEKNVKIAGMNFGVRTVVITDPDLIKTVLVKDFDHFADRRSFKFPKADALFSKMLVTQTGDKWKDLRTKMSPTFTTGKIKRMFQITKRSGDRFIKFLEEEIARSEGGEVELNNAYSKMTMDVIASTACGIDSRAFETREKSVFEQMGNKLRIEFGGLRVLKFIFMAMFPKICDFMGMSYFGQEEQDFFRGAVKSSIRHRQEKGEKPDDFIQLLLEVRANKLKAEEEELEQFEKDAIIKSTTGKDSYELDDEAITANCVLFLVGGFDTTQSLLLYSAYAMALWPEKQQKLREEVDKVFEENDGELTYDAIHKMQYLDMFINETLRLYPPAVQTDRGCVKDYKIPGTNYVIKKGEGILIPILGLHLDEKYWPEPEKFIPERFSPENKGKINQYTYLPFGQGPRNCIGMRFALTEVKVALANLVRNFRIEPSQKTLIPMKFASTGSLQPEGGMWLSLHKRTL